MWTLNWNSTWAATDDVSQVHKNTIDIYTYVWHMYMSMQEHKYRQEKRLNAGLLFCDASVASFPVPWLRLLRANTSAVSSGLVSSYWLIIFIMAKSDSSSYFRRSSVFWIVIVAGALGFYTVSWNFNELFIHSTCKLRLLFCITFKVLYYALLYL